MYRSIIGGIIFVAVFQLVYSSIDSDLYAVRDDGVITLSHVRNLVHNGFIGVSPSGERVEGYSTPLQFFFGTIAYGLTRLDYATYAYAQTIFGTFLLGAFWIGFFRGKGNFAPYLLTIVGAWLLSFHTAFFLWHGSGLENPLTHAFFLATVAILLSFVRNDKINYRWALVVFLATIARIDAVLHIAPLLVIFTVYWWCVYNRSLKGLYFSLVVFVLWVGCHSWRYFYFGDLLPNSAYGQSIDVSHRLANFAALFKQYGLWAGKNFFQHGGVLFAAVLLLYPFLHLDKVTKLFLGLSASIVFTSTFQIFLFGQARLDLPRTSTQIAVFSVLSALVVFWYILLRHKAQRGRRRELRHKAQMITIMIMCTIVVSLSYRKPYNLCCRTEGFLEIRNQFNSLALKEKLPRPTIANPDLGVMSWALDFNIVDLGKLASPILAKVAHGKNSVASDYFLDFAAPDLIESHGWWSCMYSNTIFFDTRLAERYTLVQGHIQEWMKKHCKANPESPTGIWIRKDILKSSGSPERRLIDDLAGELSTERVRQELEDCQRVPANNCVYVARTAYRFLPEFRDKGDIKALTEIFSASRTRAFDEYLILGWQDGQAHTKAIRFLRNWRHENLLDKIKQVSPVISSDFDVYFYENMLFYLKNNCTAADTKPRFFLHIIPAELNDLPVHRRQHGFDNLDFTFNATIFNGRCLAAVALPDYDKSSIRTGQFTSGPHGHHQLWGGKFKIAGAD